MGPLLVAFFSTLAKNSAYGILSIALLFIIGGILFAKVKPEEMSEV
jgi:UMF1 family MFS transporter